MPTCTLIPLPDESAENFLKRNAVEECSVKYRAEVNNLGVNMAHAREAGINAVFDKDAEHANAVFADVAAKTGKTKSVQITNDLLARALLLRSTGTDPGSPVPPTMTLTPSDLVAYGNALNSIATALSTLDGLTYAVADVA